MKILTGPLCLLFFVHSYTLRVVGNGIKAQSANPEVKVKGADPVINQIIDKLKHINQVSLSRCLIFTACTVLYTIFFPLALSFLQLSLHLLVPHSVKHMVTVSLGNLLILCASLFYGTLSISRLARFSRYAERATLKRSDYSRS